MCGEICTSREKKTGKPLGGEEIPRSYAGFSSRVLFSSNPLMQLRIPFAGRAARQRKGIARWFKASAHQSGTASHGTRHQCLDDACYDFHVPLIGAIPGEIFAGLRNVALGTLLARLLPTYSASGQSFSGEPLRQQPDNNPTARGPQTPTQSSLNVSMLVLRLPT